MNNIVVQIIKDSVNTHGTRLTTFQLKYPRFIHSEFMTHRKFSRNASSSRAIPVKKQLMRIIESPAMFSSWGLNRKGMQSKKVAEQGVQKKGESIWLKAMEGVIELSQQLADLGLHKQLVNRMGEPWSHIHVVCTGVASGYENMFALRCHADAQPEFQELAWAMADAYYSTKPTQLKPGEWHLPYVSKEELALMDIKVALRCSAARCARVSYMKHDGQKSTAEDDNALYVRLVNEDRQEWEPGHLSPLEHQAQALEDSTVQSGNFDGGWLQHRKTLPRENMHFNYEQAKVRAGRM